VCGACRSLFTDSPMPLRFFYLPPLQAEVEVRPIWVTIERGRQAIPSSGIAWDLKNHFNLNQTNLFLDIIVRLQASRLSFRAAYAQRDFASKVMVVGRPDLPWVEARFSCTDVQLTGEFDIFQRGRSRAGINLDWSTFQPTFREGAQTVGGKAIAGPTALTLGIHAVYNPTAWYYGLSPVAEARARWPVAGTQVTDWEVSLGLKTPETILGTSALKGGYRRTAIEFNDHQLWNGATVNTNFDTVLSGWFVELAYYY